MSCLVDTNVFLEILLRQAAREKCKRFLQEENDLFISDFSLHSIGVRLFRQDAVVVFGEFVADSLPNLGILSLSHAGYGEVMAAQRNFGLDFDDAYQFAVARENKLTIVTQDKDFARVKNEVAVTFI